MEPEIVGVYDQELAAAACMFDVGGAQLCRHDSFCTWARSRRPSIHCQLTREAMPYTTSRRRLTRETAIAVSALTPSMWPNTTRTVSWTPRLAGTTNATC